MVQEIFQVNRRYFVQIGDILGKSEKFQVNRRYFGAIGEIFGKNERYLSYIGDI